MAQPGVTLVKRFPYRGDPNEEFSNTYHFLGDPPSNPTDWLSLIDDLVTLEKACLLDICTYARAYGYSDTDNDADFVKDWVSDGGGATGGIAVTTQIIASGDVAAWVRWKTDYNNSKGKPVYLRKYFHGIAILAGYDDNYDHVNAAQKTALETFGTAVNTTSGDWPGLSDPHGNAPGASSASAYLTTRTLKRRGKRPH